LASQVKRPVRRLVRRSATREGGSGEQRRRKADLTLAQSFGQASQPRAKVAFQRSRFLLLSADAISYPSRIWRRRDR
jgi:hypothetical protein